MGRFGYIMAGSRRRLAQRHAFRGLRDVGLSWYDAAVRFLPRWPLPGRGVFAGIRVKGLQKPLYVRLGTSDGFILEEIFVRRIYECVTKGGLSDVRLILDLGANAGLSIRLWNEAFPRATVVGVEPDLANLKACEKNLSVIDRNDRQRVQLRRACVTDKSGTAFLDMSHDVCAFRVTDTPTARGEFVPAITVSDLLDPLGQSAEIDLMKCDIEGAEAGVFRHCARWINRVRHLIIELHPPYTVQQFLADLASNDARLEVVWHSPSEGNDLVFLKRTGGASGDGRDN